MVGSVISSTRTPQIMPVISLRLGLSRGASAKKSSKLTCFWSCSSSWAELYPVSQDLRPPPSFLLCLGDIQWVDTCEGHSVNTRLRHTALNLLYLGNFDQIAFNIVEHNIVGIASDVETYKLSGKPYDLILSIPCIEHVATKERLEKLIKRLQAATTVNGIHCFMMITSTTSAWIL